MSYRSGSRDDNKSGSIMDENNRDHCQVFDGSGEKLSMEVFCEKVSEMHCKKNLFQRKKSPAKNCKAKILKEAVLIHLRNIFKNVF